MERSGAHCHCFQLLCSVSAEGASITVQELIRTCLSHVFLGALPTNGRVVLIGDTPFEKYSLSVCFTPVLSLVGKGRAWGQGISPVQEF